MSKVSRRLGPRADKAAKKAKEEGRQSITRKAASPRVKSAD